MQDAVLFSFCPVLLLSCYPSVRFFLLSDFSLCLFFILSVFLCVRVSLCPFFFVSVFLFVKINVYLTKGIAVATLLPTIQNWLLFHGPNIVIKRGTKDFFGEAELEGIETSTEKAPFLSILSLMINFES